MDLLHLFTPSLWFALGGAGLVTVLLWRWWWASQARWFLERRGTTELPQLERVGVGDLQLTVFPREDVRRVAKHLRERRQYQTAHLDVDRTIQATLGNGGFFTPEYAQQQHVPEYLVLIELASSHDQLARLSAELVRRLADNEVFIDLFAFRSDPRICTQVFMRGEGFQESLEPPVPLSRLANLFPSSRLLIFSEGSEFINATTGRVQTWVMMFETWNQRAIVTHVPKSEWGHREILLREHFTLVPHTFEALTTHAARWTSERRVVDEVGQTRQSAGLPRQLATRGERWTYREAPPEAQLQACMLATRQYLGREGYLWLCGCCAYPNLEWNLTLLLGATLKDDQGRPLLTPERLGKLLRLPWFRYGYMPDWLRVRLLHSLSPVRYRTVRKVIDGLLFFAIIAPGQAFKLEFANPTRTLRSLTKAVLRRLARQGPTGAALQEHVFLDFMTARHSRLAIQIPAIVGVHVSEQFEDYRRRNNQRRHAAQFLPPFFGRPFASDAPYSPSGGSAHVPVEEPALLWRLGWHLHAEQALWRRDNASHLRPLLAFGMKPIDQRPLLGYERPTIKPFSPPILQNLTTMFAAMVAGVMFILAIVALAFLVTLKR